MLDEEPSSLKSSDNQQDEDVLQKEDSVEACSNEDEESVLDDSELVSSPIIEDTSMLSCVQSAVFKCNLCEKSFKTNRGLKTHVSKSHKVSTKNGHEGPEKKRKSSTDGDEFQNEDIVAPSSYEGEESVLAKHDSPVLPINEDTSGTERPEKEGKASAHEDKCKNEDIVEARSIMPKETENAGFNCNHCEKSFKTIRGLKTHVSKSHKVSTKNGHDNPSLPVDEDTSDNAAVEMKENSDEDELQKEDSVETCSNEDEESVLDNIELVSSPIIEDTSMLSCVQSSLFKCNSCEKSFKTNRGLKQHVSKSHKVSVLPIKEHTSGTERPGKKEKSSADEDKCQNEDIVEARSNNAEGSVLVESKSPYSTEEEESDDDYEDAMLTESDVESGEETNSESLKVESKSLDSTDEEEEESNDDDNEDAVLPEVLESDKETNSESLKASVERDTRPVSTKTKRIVDKLKKENSLTKSETSVAVTETKKLVDTFFEHLRVISPTLKWQRFNSGSYYDKTKNDQADEFDIMIYPDNIQVEVNFDSPISGFYKVKFESPRVEENLKNQVETNGYIHPGKFKEYVFGLFDQVFQSTEHHMFRRVTKKERSDNSSPAYTIFYNGIPGKPIDIDLVPCFRINTWPCIARKINPTWIHSKLGNIVNDAIKCYDVVSKTCPDDVEDSHLFWRLSFSYTEKKLVNSANSVDKFSTKKTVFRLIKSLIQELKDNNPAIMKKFCSYHIKQFMFKQYDTWGEIYDDAKTLRNVLQKLLEQLSSSPPFIENYFIEKDNVIRYVPQTEIALIVKFLRDKMKEL
ncbi:MB21D1 [Mytilus edulis]|uniref:MB21D1 n=1 Tax=Mytilus edulis TaxID=6550 RepID=A0A8S3T9W6_MYTED|nr:MB21D1 [Mytilus edulis]